MKIFKDSEIKKQALRVIEELGLMNSVLEFLQDSGNYANCKKYKMNGVEIQQKAKELKEKILHLQANMIFADILLSKKKGLIKKYDLLAQRIFKEMTIIQIKHQEEVLEKNKIN